MSRKSQLGLVLALLFAGRLLELGSAYFTSLAVGAVCFLRQQWLARNRDAPGCMRAFHENHYFGVVVLAGVIVDFASRR